MQSHQQLDQKLGKKIVTKISAGSAMFMAIAIACCTPTLPARAALFDGPVDRLPSVQRDSLRKGQTVVTGSSGKYVARVLLTASPDAVWRVLTDYANLYKFIPNMTSSSSSVPKRPANQILITYTVNAQPKSGTPTDAFYGIFKEALGDTLQAIKREVSNRN